MAWLHLLRAEPHPHDQQLCRNSHWLQGLSLRQAAHSWLGPVAALSRCGKPDVTAGNSIALSFECDAVRSICAPRADAAMLCGPPALFS